jgi:hypothetical protein
MIDYKKTERELYQPKTTPSIVDVPAMKFAIVDGCGDPNNNAEYSAAIELLYGISYAIKMGNKAILEYVVPPLEGFWETDDSSIADKSKFVWTMCIRQPDFVTAEIFEGALAKVAKKKPNLDLAKARLETIAEGLCVQIMHIGPYDDEPATVAKLDQYALDSGYAIDIGGLRRHHEIYLQSDPRKIAPEKLKTVLRHPIKR